MYITHFWGSVDWARVATRYAETSGEVVPEALPSPDRQGAYFLFCFFNSFTFFLVYCAPATLPYLFYYLVVFFVVLRT